MINNSYTKSVRTHITRKSFWLSTRPVTIALLTVTYAVFSISLTLDFNWRFGWLLLGFSLIADIIQSSIDLRRKYFTFDSALFSTGMMVFAVSDVLVTIAVGGSFPAIPGHSYDGNYVGNLTGLVIVTFVISFFTGRIFVPAKVYYQRAANFRSNAPWSENTWILIFSTFIAFLAFLANGDELSISNISSTILARSGGYVAFSSSGLGNVNPLLTLIAASIPAAIILWGAGMSRGRFGFNIIAACFGLSLFILFILTGGRSGAIMVILTIVIFKFIQKDIRLHVLKSLFIILLSVLVLTIQSNFRDTGKLSFSDIEHSPMRGYSLNREVAFIVSVYGESENFFRTGISQVFLPIPETIVLFLSNPIPRIFWPSKPIDPSFGPYNSIRTGETGFGATSNITPTIPGRFYMLYGFSGVIQIGITLGILWRWIDQKLMDAGNRNLNISLMFAMLSAIMFISIRDLTPGKFYPFLWLALFLYLSKFSYRSK